MNIEKKIPFYYGWIIVATSFITLGVAFGVWYSFSVLYIALIDDFAWNRATTAGIFSLFTISHYLCAFLTGWLIDHFGPRLVIPIGALWLALALNLLTRAGSLFDFYLIYGIMAAVGVSLIGFVPHATFLPRWFSKRRGLAIGLAMAGVGVGMLTIPPFIQHLISLHGWRHAYRTLAVIVLFTIPINLFFQRRDPEQIGLYPDNAITHHDNDLSSKEGAPSKNAQNPGKQEQESGSSSMIIDKEWTTTKWTSHNALRTNRFWYLAAGFFLGPFAIQGVLLHAVAGLVDGGMSAKSAAATFGLLGICGSVGKITLGFFGDRWNRETANTVGMMAATIGVLALSKMELQPQLLPYIFALCFGFGYGAVAPLFPSIAADIFQGQHFGRIFGLLSLNLGFGGAAGAWFAGLIFDQTGSYQIAFILDIVVLWLSCICFWLAAPRKVRLSQRKK
ncbi:MAG: MFS transporter [Deltaproteobacteria bacterium]|nr:MFS transporter [Deltaproteobacteria bacterium]